MCVVSGRIFLHRCAAVALGWVDEGIDVVRDPAAVPFGRFARINGTPGGSDSCVSLLYPSRSVIQLNAAPFSFRLECDTSQNVSREHKLGSSTVCTVKQACHDRLLFLNRCKLLVSVIDLKGRCHAFKKRETTE